MSLQEITSENEKKGIDRGSVMERTFYVCFSIKKAEERKSNYLKKRDNLKKVEDLVTKKCGKKGSY